MPQSPGEVVDSALEGQPDDNTLVSYKIHLHGLNDMNPAEVGAYIAEHYPENRFEKIEWIDDNSANLIFTNGSTATDALVALAAVEIADVTLLPARELLPAKPFSQKSTAQLQVRFAVAADRKQPGAAERSRFYLFNPKYDPENRRKYRDRDGQQSGRIGRGRHSREDEPIDHFDVNLYDDDSTALATRNSNSQSRRRRSYTPGHNDDDHQPTSYRNQNRNKELFPSSGRDRSASPGQNHRMRDTPPSGGSAERNRRGAKAIKDRLVRGNRSRELFPSNGPASGSDRLEETNELSERFTLPLNDSDEVPAHRNRKLEERITTTTSGARLADRITDPVASSGFSIRGTAGQRSSNQGFAIKGGAKTARELFPDKLGENSGRELFADKIEGRLGQRQQRPRQRAGDLFD